MVAQNTDLRASLAFGTVKNRISTWGRPAVPNISAMPNEIAEIGSVMKLPGDMMVSPLVCTSVALANSASGLKLKADSTISDMNVAPQSSRTALMI